MSFFINCPGLQPWAINKKTVLRKRRFLILNNPTKKIYNKPEAIMSSGSL
jgi:hypothetical protein